MRRSTLFVLGTGIAVGGVLASGFPRRIGLTASQAAISLPGDLLVPDADIVADRGVEINAPAQIVWRVLDEAFEDDGSRVIDQKEGDYLLMRAPAPADVEGDDAYGTCVIALLPITQDRTLLHLRERYASEESGASKASLWAALTLESWSSMRMLRDIAAACQ
ncbi:hypothetical protein [Schaalia vaccimaxillae]|uniref:hypothetical protein n=1 Tax=Schaalia vaccimaxillae TaxID=183916 RepID=UPI0003B3969F|nr:hypothetical protein [Schaalia vaccimaxillae]